MEPWEGFGGGAKGYNLRAGTGQREQEVALRWREAEPPTHFLSGLRKCCLRQMLPETGWGGVRVPQIRGMCVQGHQ